MYCIEMVGYTGRTEAIYGPYTEETAEEKAAQLRQQDDEQGDSRAPTQFKVRKLATY